MVFLVQNDLKQDACTGVHSACRREENGHSLDICNLCATPSTAQAGADAGISWSALSQSGEISPDFCCFYGGGIRHNEDIMHSFQNFIVRLIPNHPPPLETTIWKLVVRALFLVLKWRGGGVVLICKYGI